MPTKKTTVTVRMYNVGFGDSFLVTVGGPTATWRMLVDCGVHNQGAATVDGRKRQIGEVVRAIINDLGRGGADPHLDVVVATHHHADHISGFADPAWAGVEVGEVWVPYVENPFDSDAQGLRTALAATADSLQKLAEEAQAESPRGSTRSSNLALAASFAANSTGNAAATDRLLSRNGSGFKNSPRTRYLPYRQSARNVIATTVPGATVHVLGPSRDPAQLKRMNPPASARWLQLDADRRNAASGTPDLFDASYRVPEQYVATQISQTLLDAKRLMELQKLDEGVELLAAASVLERSVNNTSLFFVLDVLGTRLAFVGDSQQGAWEHVLDDPAARELVTNVAFYKIGHHGSHNATPRRYVDEVMGDTGTWAMMPFGPVTQWADIPKRELLDELAVHQVKLLRADQPQAQAHVKVADDGLWTELTLKAD